MIAFQSVTASARTAEGMAEAIGIASITATHRKKFKRFIGLILSLGLRYNEKTSFPARRPSAGSLPGRWGVLAGKDPTCRFCFKNHLKHRGTQTQRRHVILVVLLCASGVS